MMLSGRKIGIIGAVRSGVSVALKALYLGANVLISDIKPQTEVQKIFLKYFTSTDWDRILPYCEFGQHSDSLLESDLIVVSPGVPKNIDIIQRALKKKIKVIGDIEFGYLIKNKDSKIIAVTGSNGKSTTASLIHHILKDFGYDTILAGNIGKPFTSFPIEKKGIDFIVLELSSFQLEYIDSFTPNSAVILNITPDHLDRYANFQEYVDAKLRITMNQSMADIVVLSDDDPILHDIIPKQYSQIALFKRSLPIQTDEATITTYLEDNHIVLNKKFGDDLKDHRVDISKIQLFGLHNKFNIMAAILAVYDIISMSEHKNDVISRLEQSINSFRALPHRLELVDTVNGIKFVNDSKATNTDSVKYALSSFDDGIHLIIGGYDKGEDYSILNQLINQKVKKVYLIGSTREKMLQQFSLDEDMIEVHDTLQSSVLSAYKNAKSGEVVLLAPACASFDMFSDFEHRGEVFRSIVQEVRDNEN